MQVSLAGIQCNAEISNNVHWPRTPAQHNVSMPCPGRHDEQPVNATGRLRQLACDYDVTSVLCDITDFLEIIIDPIHAAAMTDKKRGLACRFTANLRVSTKMMT